MLLKYKKNSVVQSFEDEDLLSRLDRFRCWPLGEQTHPVGPEPAGAAGQAAPARPADRRRSAPGRR